MFKKKSSFVIFKTTVIERLLLLDTSFIRQKMGLGTQEKFMKTVLFVFVFQLLTQVSLHILEVQWSKSNNQRAVHFIECLEWSQFHA